MSRAVSSSGLLLKRHRCASRVLLLGALCVLAAPALADNVVVTFQEIDEEGCHHLLVTGDPAGGDNRITAIRLHAGPGDSRLAEVTADPEWRITWDEVEERFLSVGYSPAVPSVELTICLAGDQEERDWSTYTLEVFCLGTLPALEEPSGEASLERPVHAQVVRPEDEDGDFTAVFALRKDDADCDTARIESSENVEVEDPPECETPDEPIGVVLIVKGRITGERGWVAASVDPAGETFLLVTDVRTVTLPPCVPAPVPAATLLFPYFEVDLDDPEGPTTLISVNNTDESCTLARVTLWTDLAVPTLTSYVYLSPNDVQTLNLRAVFNGQLPDTSAVLSNPECPVLDFSICQPAELSPELVALDLASLAADHTGAPNPSTGRCAGVDRGDLIARGYVTADAVAGCAFPPTVRTWEQEEWEAAEGYFEATQTLTRNALWGDYFLVDDRGNSAQSANAVHLVAAPDRFSPGEITFYGRYTGYNAGDGRLPLGGAAAARFLNGGPFDGGTDLIIWRSTRSPEIEPVACGALPEWAPLGQASLLIFDEAETPFEPPATPIAPWAVQRVPVGGSALPVPVPFGWLDLDLAHAPGLPAQAWVGAVSTALGRFSVHQEAVWRNDLCHRRAVALDPP